MQNRVESMVTQKTKFENFELRDDLRPILGAFNYDNDLTFCLLATSYIDACLTDYLLSKLRKSSVTSSMLNHKGPLGSIFSKAQLSYSLSLIEKVYYQDIVKLAEIRNEFAHLHTRITFDNDRIVKLCNELNLSYIAPLEKMSESGQAQVLSFLEGAKNRFSIALISISNVLLYTGSENIHA
jgi:DNA-binding MltR family transcriptional regulator